MSRSVDVYEAQLEEHFNELFGEQHADSDLYYAYIEGFENGVEDLDVLEGELAGEFHYLIENAWEDYFGDDDEDGGVDPSLLRDVTDLSDAMAQFAVDTLLDGNTYPDFYRSPEVAQALPGFQNVWEEKKGEWVDWEGRQGEQILGPIFSTAAEKSEERFADWADNAEYTMTGDATEAAKDYIRENYEEFKALALELDIDPEEYY